MYRSSIMSVLFCFVILQGASTFASQSQQNVISHTHISQSVVENQGPSNSILDSTKEETSKKVNDNYHFRPCSCGGPGWTRVGHINMSDPNHHCPPNWTPIKAPIRACGRSSKKYLTCDSAILPVNGMSYSSVCGRVVAYQRGGASAFNDGIINGATIDDAYVAGMSLTHGAPGSRAHVWSFSTALGERAPYVTFVCPCNSSNIKWPYQIPSYVGGNYFCDTGNPGIYASYTKVFSKPLWNGKGCGAYSTCCQFNRPPWFCKFLQSSTTEDLELRLCSYAPYEAEDNLVSLVEIYIK